MFIRVTCRIAAAALIPLLAVTGCVAPDRSHDFRDNHPIAVGTEKLTLKLTAPVPRSGPVGVQEITFKRFVNDFIDRKNGKMEVVVGGSAMEQVAQEVRVRDLLAREGIPTAEVMFDRTGDANEIVLSFEANSVTVPECGDWSSHVGLNWSNRTHSNFGCAYQRNLGLTVADPRDLKQAKPMSRPDAVRSSRVIGGQRDGTAGTAAGAGAGATAN